MSSILFGLGFTPSEGFHRPGRARSFPEIDAAVRFAIEQVPSGEREQLIIQVDNGPDIRIAEIEARYAALTADPTVR